MLLLANMRNGLLLYFKMMPEKGVEVEGECGALGPYSSTSRFTVARALPQDFGEVPAAPLVPGSFEDWHKERGHWLLWDFSFCC